MMRNAFARAVFALGLLAFIAVSSPQAALGQAEGNGGFFDPEPQPATEGTPPTNALDKTDLEFFLRHLYLMESDVSVEITDYRPSSIEGLMEVMLKASKGDRSQQRSYLVSKDGKNIIEGKSYDITENPFHKNLEKINNVGRPAFGEEGAPVVISVFSDFQCPYCAKEAKVLRTQVAENYPDNVRVYYHDYPLKMHNWAYQASIAGQCIQQIDPEAFWKYHDWIFENQKTITEQNLNDKVGEFASTQGLDILKLSPCIENQGTKAIIDDSIQLAQELGVRSTPTMYVNGRQLKGDAQWSQLQKIIDYEIGYQKITENAGDDCGCQVEVDIPGQN